MKFLVYYNLTVEIGDEVLREKMKRSRRSNRECMERKRSHRAEIPHPRVINKSDVVLKNVAQKHCSIEYRTTLMY